MFQLLLGSIAVQPEMMKIYENDLLAEYAKRNTNRTVSGKQR